LPAGRYQVTFRLQATDIVRPGCIRLDVSADSDINDGPWLTKLPHRYVEAEDIKAGQFSELTLIFDSIGASGYEYRVYESCDEEVLVDWIEVAPLVQPAT
jgi:hypothetical protein